MMFVDVDGGEVDDEDDDRSLCLVVSESICLITSAIEGGWSRAAET